MSIIIVDDLLKAPGVTGDVDSGLLDNLVDGANDLVGEAWVAPVSPVPIWVRNIAISVALRGLHNPKGLAMLSRQIDDAKRTEGYADSWAGVVGLHLTDQERMMLGGTVTTRRVGTIHARPRLTQPTWSGRVFHRY